ncbi:MAG: TauD/TfdA family dioxygenase [Pseudomonadota bacterium]
MTELALPWTPDFEAYPVDHSIASAETSQQVVTVHWSDGQRSEHHALWLRENSPDEETVHPVSREMLIDPLDIPDDIVAASARVASNGALEVAWSDRPQASQYHPGWLRAHAWFDKESSRDASQLRLWTTNDISEPITTDCSAALGDGRVFADWLEALRDYGVARLSGVPVKDGMLEEIVERIGTIRPTNFGKLFQVVVKNDPNSNAYTSTTLVPHMDLGTRETPPGLQFLFCRENSTTGGEGVYVDAYRIAEDMRREEPDNFASLSTIVWEFKNRAKDSDYRAYGPIFSLDQAGDLAEVRYTPWLRAPLRAPIDIQARAYQSIRAFMRRNADPKYQMHVTYRPGDLLAFDNRRVLHGRSSYSEAGGHRHLEGCYADRDDLHSAIRLMRRKTAQAVA